MKYETEIKQLLEENGEDRYLIPGYGFDLHQFDKDFRSRFGQVPFWEEILYDIACNKMAEEVLRKRGLI